MYVYVQYVMKLLLLVFESVHKIIWIIFSETGWIKIIFEHQYPVITNNWKGEKSWEFIGQNKWEPY